MNTPAPIVLFAFNRPEHTLKTLQALKKNKLADISLLLVYIDGPKPNATLDDINKTNKVITVVESDLWCKEVKVIKRETNIGLSKSITSGVSEVIEKHGKVIVLEDDIVTDIYFLQFMNDALEKYNESENIACISGYIYPVKTKLPETFFIKGADCWGWATWKRAWERFNKEDDKLLEQITSGNFSYDFDFYNTYPYVQMLQDKILKKNDSWAISWYASSYLQNALCLYPGISLVQNIGMDGSGVQLKGKEVPIKKIEEKENRLAKKSIAAYFKKLKKSNISFIGKIKTIIKQFIN
jgi:hypothetical protein